MFLIKTILALKFRQGNCFKYSLLKLLYAKKLISGLSIKEGLIE